MEVKSSQVHWYQHKAVWLVTPISLVAGAVLFNKLSSFTASRWVSWSATTAVVVAPPLLVGAATAYLSPKSEPFDPVEQSASTTAEKSPLGLACEGDNLDQAMDLLESAEPQAIREALNSAQQEGREKIALLLECWLETPVDALHTVASEGWDDLFDFVFELQTDRSTLNDHGQTPLHVACERENLYQLQRLLTDDEVRVDGLDQSGRSPFSIALSTENKELVSILLTCGVNPESGEKVGPNIWDRCWYREWGGTEEMTAFLMQCSRELPKELFKRQREWSHVADLWMNRSTHNPGLMELMAYCERQFKPIELWSIHDAVDSDSIETLRARLKVNQDGIDELDRGGRTPLLLACEYKEGQIALDLIGAGADPLIVSPGGSSVTVLAQGRGPAFGRAIQRAISEVRPNALAHLSQLEDCKMAAHVFGFSGYMRLKRGGAFELGGGTCEFWIPEFCAALRAHNHGRLGRALESFASAVSRLGGPHRNAPSSQPVQLIRASLAGIEGESVWSHAVLYLVSNDHLVICNHSTGLGQGKIYKWILKIQDKAPIFAINRGQLRSTRDHRTFERQLVKAISKGGDPIRNAHLEEHSPLNLQLAPNCSWYCYEIALWAHLSLSLGLEEGNKGCRKVMETLKGNLLMKIHSHIQSDVEFVMRDDMKKFLQLAVTSRGNSFE